jgi:hypothetical protein
VAFGLERLVYRLSASDYRDRFVLKGGMLVTLWTADTGRFTRDIDFLAFGSDEEAALKEAFSTILAIDGGDGLNYDAANLTAAPIREDQIYGGMRLRTTAYLGTTQIPITVDLGFGDALGDPKYQIDYASLLDFPSASIRAYSPATVIAEKFQAVVALGIANSRMKDLMICGHCRRRSRSIAKNWPIRSEEHSTEGEQPYRRLVRWDCHQNFPPIQPSRRNGEPTPAGQRWRESHWQRSPQRSGRRWNQYVGLHHDDCAFQGGLVER